MVHVSDLLVRMVNSGVSVVDDQVSDPDVVRDHDVCDRSGVFSHHRNQLIRQSLAACRSNEKAELTKVASSIDSLQIRLVDKIDVRALIDKETTEKRIFVHGDVAKLVRQDTKLSFK